MIGGRYEHWLSCAIPACWAACVRVVADDIFNPGIAYANVQPVALETSCATFTACAVVRIDLTVRKDQMYVIVVPQARWLWKTP